VGISAPFSNQSDKFNNAGPQRESPPPKIEGENYKKLQSIAEKVIKGNLSLEELSSTASKNLNNQSVRDFGNEYKDAIEQTKEKENAWKSEVKEFAERIKDGEDKDTVFKKMAETLDHLIIESEYKTKKIYPAEMATAKIGSAAQVVIMCTLLVDEFTEQELLSEITTFSDLGTFTTQNALVLALSISKSCMKGKKIKKLSKELTNLKKNLTVEDNQNHKIIIENKIAHLEENISALKADVTNDLKNTCYKFLQTTLGTSTKAIKITASFLESSSNVSKHVLTDLAITTSSIGLATGLLSIGLNSYSAINSNKKLRKVNKQIKLIKKGSETLERTKKNIQAFEKNISSLNEKITKAKTLKTWRKRQDQFKKFANIYTLKIVESMINEALQEPDKTENLIVFLKKHDFNPKTPLDFNNILDFILK